MITNRNRIDMIFEAFGIDPCFHISKNYGKEYGKIMRGIIDIEIANILKSHNNMRDNRGMLNYAQQNLLNWALEDFMEMLLAKDGYQVKRNGTDKNHRFDIQKNITTAPDFHLMKDGKEFFCEMISDFGGYWDRTNEGDFRGKKLLHLKNLSKTKNVLVLAVDIKNKKYGLIEITPDTRADYKTNPLWGGKISYSTDINTSNFKLIIA